MSSKHYKEQKMLIENFRKWQEDSDTEKEVIQYCKTHMELPIDEKYITDTFNMYMGEKDVRHN